MLFSLAMLAATLMGIGGPMTFFDPEDGNGDGGAASDDGTTDDGGEPQGVEDGQPNSGDADSGPSIAVLEDQLEAQRARNEQLEQRLEALESGGDDDDGDPEADEKTQAEIDKLRRRAEEAEQEARNRLVDAELHLAAAEAGLRNPKRTLRLIDRSDIAVKDDGTVAGATAAVDALKEEMPELFGGADDQTPTRTAADDTGKSKGSDKGKGGEPETDYERGKAAARRVKKKRNSGRL